MIETLLQLSSGAASGSTTGTGNSYSFIILMVVLLLIGIGEIARSLSKKMAREDKLEAMDERNRLITWKSKSKAFQLTQVISFFLMLILLVMGKVSGYEGFTAMGVGLAFTYTISMFAELGAYLYYESKN